MTANPKPTAEADVGADYLTEKQVGDLAALDRHCDCESFCVHDQANDTVAELGGWAAIAVQKSREIARLRAVIDGLKKGTHEMGCMVEENEAEITRLREQLGLVRACVNCGKVVPSTHDRAYPRPGCQSPDACTFDITPQELIIHLKAKLAEARARADVAFAAGIEAAAKWVSDQSVVLRNHAKAHEPMTTTSDPPLTRVSAMANANRVRELYRDADKYEIHAKVIRALTPPDITAAAARVLLADMHRNPAESPEALHRWEEVNGAMGGNVEAWRNLKLALTVIANRGK